MNGIEQILQTGSAFVNRCVVTADIAYHIHNFIEIAYVAEGSGVHIINGTTYHIAKGDLFLINYDTPHQFSEAEGPLLIYNCIFTPAYFDVTLRESRNFFDITDHFLLTNLYTNLPTDYIFVTAYGSENNHIRNIYERMLQEFSAKQLGYRDIMRGYIIELLVILCRLKLCVASDKTQKMLKILAHINEHYREKLKIEDLASLAGFSESHFRRTFQSLTGKSLSRYLQTFRVEEACRLLKNREMSMEQVAQEVGYSDMKHFYSVFKKITGKLPKEFR